MTKPKYLQLVEESCDETLKHVKSLELDQYIRDEEFGELNATKIERDELSARQVYVLSTWSGMVAMREMLTRLHEKGDSKPFVLGGSHEPNLKEILEELGDTATAKHEDGVTTITVVSDGSDLDKIFETIKKSIRKEDK